MLKKYPILKWSLVFITFLIILVFGFGWWFMNLLPANEESPDLSSVRAEELSYLNQKDVPLRGRILAIVTSTDSMGDSGKNTGYELTELSRAYYVFQANGFEVDIASPLGGQPTVVIDDEDMGAFDYAFLNDSIAQYKTRNTISIEDVDEQEYEAVYFVGGKGAMFDFPDNPHIQALIRNLYQSGRVVGAVCHGPAALVNVRLDNGRYLIENKNVSGFTNEEELLLIPDAASIFPFLLQDKISEQGASFIAGEMYLEQVSHEGNLITGQNPWSTWKLAETMISEMGYIPVPRTITSEENAVRVLNAYQSNGGRTARKMVRDIYETNDEHIDRILIAKHSIIAAMQGNLGNFFGLVRLTSYVKSREQGRKD